jgi:ABC-type phosphate transport system ATPase subunit
LHVLREHAIVRAWTDQLSERSTGNATQKIHLEEPILRLHVTHHEVHVVIVPSKDMGDAERIADDTHFIAKTAKRDGRDLSDAPPQ